MSDNDLKELKASTDIVAVISKFTDLKRKGRYYEGICPFHEDTTVGSFKVNPAKQSYRCYSCGANGDSLSFLTGMGNTFKKSIEMLKGNTPIEGEVLEKSNKEQVILADFSYIKPLDSIDPKNFIHSKLGEPAHTYTYYDKDNKLLGYVLRYHYEGEKYILPYNYGICTQAGWQYENGGKGSGKYYELGDIMFRFLGFGEHKPIYGAEKILANPKATIVIVEGEACVDFVQERYDPKKVVVITFQGGTNNVDKCDWSILDGRRCFLLQDNDEPSEKAFTWLAEELNNIALEVNRVALADPNSKPKGWDVRDNPKWGAQDITNYIKINIRK